jgi:hypothetical protein
MFGVSLPVEGAPGDVVYKVGVSVDMFELYDVVGDGCSAVI